MGRDWPVMSATRKPTLEMAIVCAAYATQRISSLRNGMHKNCLFGTYRALRNQKLFCRTKFRVPATIRIDKNEGRITCLSGRKSRVRVASPMCQAAHKGRNRPDVSTKTRRDTFGLSKRMPKKLADCSRFA